MPRFVSFVPYMIRYRPRYQSINAQETDVQVAYNTINNRPEPELPWGLDVLSARYHLIRLPALGTRCRPFIPSEKDKIITEKLKLGIVPKSPLSRLDFVINFSQFLSRKESQLLETKTRERKENWQDTLG